jgi:Tfp pilus assembly protein PilF
MPLLAQFARIAALAAALLASVPATPAQHEVHGPAPGDPVPEEILERPVPLRQGIGVVHEKITTSSADAQAFYDQGVAYLNSFEWIEAARSFHQALRADANCAMAHLGLSDAYMGLLQLPEARTEFEAAQSLADSVSPRERSRITIRAKQLDYLADGGNLQKYFAYRQAITDAIRATPADPWLWILRGFADEGSPYARGQGGGADTIAFYQAAITHAPDNFAAHHYLAHTYENLGLVDLALEQDEIYVKAAPMVPHAHHMVGHDLRRAGRTEEAVEEFLKAEELENAYYRAENIPAKYDWHHAHNLTLLAMCYESLGEDKLAEAAYREAFALPANVDLAEFNRKAWPEFLLSEGRAQEALAAAGELIQSSFPLGRFAGYTVAGEAQLALNHPGEAHDSLTKAEEESEHIAANLIATLPNAGKLRAEILLREGRQAGGDAVMKQIEQRIEAVPGPDAWSAALFELESIAQVARQAGDWELAESTAKLMIQHDPTYAGGHLELALAARHRGDSASASAEFSAAQKLWSHADPEVQRRVSNSD